MIKFRTRSVIILELLLMLVGSLAIGIAFFILDSKATLTRQYTHDLALVGQAFTEHRNEILTGTNEGFQAALSHIANVSDLRLFEIRYEISGITTYVSQDLGRREFAQPTTDCQAFGIREIFDWRNACFEATFNWEKDSKDPLVALRWWPSVDQSAHEGTSSSFILLAALLIGGVICILHWLLFQKVMLNPISNLISRFDHYVRTGHLPPASAVKPLLMNTDTQKLVDQFDHLIRVSQDYQAIRERSIRFEATDQIVKQVVHDLHSPLTALKFSHELISRTVDPEVHDLSGKALSRITEILATLKPATKTDLAAGRETRVLNSVAEVGSLVENIVLEAQFIHRHHPSIVFRFLSFSKHPGFVKFDPVEMRRAISNLLTNAVQAFPNMAGEVEISVHDNGNEIAIKVTDSGIGIPPEILARVGSKGFSFGKTNREDAGSGLGFYHARETITEAGGRISIESKVGRGTEVKILLPRFPMPNSSVDRLLVPLNVIVEEDLE